MHQFKHKGTNSFTLFRRDCSLSRRHDGATVSCSLPTNCKGYKKTRAGSPEKLCRFILCMLVLFCEKIQDFYPAGRQLHQNFWHANR